MQITFETNENGDPVKVTTTASGSVIREIDWPVVAAPVVNPTEWLIDIGPFFDRFGPARMAVLSSQDATVRAIVQDSMARKWIHLQRPEVAQGLAYIGSMVPAVTAQLQAEIVSTPVTGDENLALRKTYF